MLQRLLPGLCLAVLLCACGARAPEQTSPPPPALGEAFTPLSQEEARGLVQRLSPAQQGLASWKELGFALSQSLAHAQGRPQDQPVLAAAGGAFVWSDLCTALRRLEALLPVLDTEPGRLATDFRWYRLKRDFLVTGYYEPEIPASPVPQPGFSHPLYRRPPDLDALQAQGKPYYSRRQIDMEGALKGQGLELAWLANPVDAFMLQIQGSGRLRYPDGRVQAVLFAGRNGQPYTALGKVMADRGLLPREGISMYSIRDWLNAHPDRQAELMACNAAYVFFRFGDGAGPVGSMGRVLTPRVSAATDQGVLPNGLLTAMFFNLPDARGGMTRPFGGVLLPQDTGSAIRGGRVDFFCGHGPEAEETAAHLKAQGEVYLLLP